MVQDVKIRGDASRQAISTLRGYAYQLYESALAWTSLAEEEFLFLEVAEDYALATADAVNAVQVKATAAAITLNSSDVVETINAFFDLSNRNPDKRVVLKHLTTAQIGMERNSADRIFGGSGLEYWVAVQSGADVEPLKERLLRLKLSQHATEFLRKSSGREINDNLIMRIEWLTGARSLEVLRRDLSNRLVYIGEKRGISSTLCDTMIDPLLSRMLVLASTPGQRRLERADFIRFFDEASRVSLPVTAVEAMMNAVRAPAATTQSFASTFAILRPAASFNPTKFAVRVSLAAKINRVVNDYSFVWLHGATDTGKSTLAKLVAHATGPDWYFLSLRSLVGRETAEALYKAASQIAIERPRLVVVDDLSPLPGRVEKDAFANLLDTARKSSTAIVVTSNSEPPHNLRAVFEDEIEIVVRVGNLSQDEVAGFVRENDGDPTSWARYIFLATGSGHPLLVDAMVRGLRLQNWSTDELSQLSGILGKNQDIEAVKSEVRERMFSELRPDESTLLVRLSFILGTFKREMAMFLGELDPAIGLPGKAFDGLRGAWIEEESNDRFRLSSLVSNAGGQTVGPQASTRIHHELGNYYTRGPHLDADRLNDMILHGMAGKNEKALLAASIGLMTASPDDLQIIAQYNASLAALRIDQPLYPENPKVSLFLRIAQVLLLAASKDSRRYPKALEAFEREFSQQRDSPEKNYSHYIIYTKCLLIPGFVELVGDLAQFTLIAVDRVAENDLVLTPIELQSLGTVSSLAEFLQFAFAHQLSQIKEIATLHRVMRDLMAKTKEQRQFLLKAFKSDHFEKELVIKTTWARLDERGGKFSEADASEFTVLGRELAAAEEPEFATAAFESAAVIYDEHLGDSDRAIACIKEAIALLGDSLSLTRALSRLYFHEKKYERQLELGMPLVERFSGGSTEAAFFFRELAIGNSCLDLHGQAKELYDDAFRRVTNDPQKPKPYPMAAGLIADAAVEAHWSGNDAEAIRRLEVALRMADQLDPEASLQAAAVVRLIAHSVVWLMLDVHGDLENVPKHAMIPGANSNPSPHEGLTGKMALSLDYVWYVLAEAAASAGVEFDLAATLLSPDWDGRVVLTSELTFLASITSSAERRLCTAEYLARLPRAIDARAYLEANAVSMMSIDLSPRTRVPKSTTAEFELQREKFAQPLMTFALRLAFRVSPAAATMFVVAAAGLERPLITNEMADTFARGSVTESNDEVALSGTVGSIVGTLTDGSLLSAKDLMVACLRLFELLENEFSEPTAVTSAVEWALQQWKSAVKIQAFQLSSPRLAEQAVAEFEQSASGKIEDIAKLILAMTPFVRVHLGADYKSWLVQVSVRNDTCSD